MFGQGSEVPRTNEKLVQVLVQLTSALRRFAEQTQFMSQFISHRIIDELCVSSVLYATEYELMINICSSLRYIHVYTVVVSVFNYYAFH